MAVIERITLDGARLKNADIALSGICDRLLIGHLGDFVPSSGKVLDLGAGTGANGLYFARNGCSVDLIDVSPDAVSICAGYAKDLGLSVRTEVADARNVSLASNTYDLIILSYLLQFLTAEEGHQVIKNCIAALKPGGALYVSTFSLEEELHKELIAESAAENSSVQKIGNATFRLESGRVLHFQDESQLLSNCSELKCKHFFSGRELDECHGAPHYHSFLSYIGIKP